MTRRSRAVAARRRAPLLTATILLTALAVGPGLTAHAADPEPLLGPPPSVAGGVTTALTLLTPTDPGDPAPTEPVAPEPGASEPVVPEPGPSEPVVPEEPGASEPVVPEDPGASEPVVPEDPGASEPVVPDPGASEPVVPDPGASEPVVPDPGASETPGDDDTGDGGGSGSDDRDTAEPPAEPTPAPSPRPRDRDGDRDGGRGGGDDDEGPSGPPSSSVRPGATLASVETGSLPVGTGDIADDVAIWADPDDPSRSVVIADSKDDRSGGVAVWDMSGELLQFRQGGEIGNIDLRADFRLGDRDVVLVGANNRTDDSLVFWTYDPERREISAPVNARVSTHDSNYGFCLYRSAVSGTTYAFVTQDEGSGSVQQFELSGESGQVQAQLVRTFHTGSRSEACVADDELGQFYVAEEDVAVWRYGAEPGDGSARTAVDRAGAGHLTADVEGLGIAGDDAGGGHLVVSSQGSSSFAVYDRADDNAYLGVFAVGGRGGIDDVQGTDGLDVSTADLGPGFASGALIVHDEANVGGETSNLKYVPLETVLDGRLMVEREALPAPR